MEELPKGMSDDAKLMLRTWCMPADTNPSGDIFGGWLMAQMDVAGALAAKEVVNGRTVTVAVDAMSFHNPVYVGDILCCYTTIERAGRTSVTVHVCAYVKRMHHEEKIHVTEGTFVFVSVDDNGKPRPFKQEGSQ